MLSDPAARREQLRAREEFISAFAAGPVCAGFTRAPMPRHLLYESVAGNS
ncbi:MAG TPA: hypothetical protein VIW80_12475 [Pyrinomonadaceae bacterium]